MKYVTPSVRETAFNCPHCGALAKQFWHSVHASANNEKDPKPLMPPADVREFLEGIKDDATRENVENFIKKLSAGRPFVEEHDSAVYNYKTIQNVHISRCFNCKDISLWIFDRLAYPQRGEAPPANEDLPHDIRRDYEEASAILDLSPRGAAALIRLCIQKLCKHLGQPGENINADIAALVASGLDRRVQKALDAVRVIGNNAVHPGELDLRDDRATAESLFRLLNLIAEKMISEPKHVEEVYSMLPDGARKAIEKRDASKD